MMPVYIYDAVRTPRGKAKDSGALAGLSPQELVRQQIAALQERNGDRASTPDSLLLGCVGQVGAQGAHIALISKLFAGLPDETAAHTINNYCASGLTAIGQAAAMISAGHADTAMAGGVEMMSQVPFMGDNANYYIDTKMPHRARYIPVVLAADRLANSERITREELDAVALASQEKSAAAESNAALGLSRITVRDDQGDVVLDREECIRPATDADGLSAMAPAFGALQEQYQHALDGQRFEPRHTLSHAPPVCDGAGLALLGSEPANADTARARIIAFAESGGNPEKSLTAGLAAMEKVLKNAGLALADMDRIEFMEAFAVTIAKFVRDYPVDRERLNVSGGHIAKGHPMGATGAILLSTLLDCLDAADGRYGLVVVSGATGVGAAMVVERLR